MISKKTKKQIDKLPKHIRKKLAYWMDFIAENRIEEMRMIKGFNDELLTNRNGQRSSRLNEDWRVIYTEQGEIIEVIEVNKHDY